MQALRRSVKTHWGLSSIGSSLSAGFQVYFSKFWDPYVSPGSMIQLVFLWGLSCFSMLILSIPFLVLGFKSTSLSPEFCVCMPRSTIRFDGS